jgi:hypothetical protein
MKRALLVIASVGILAVTVAMESANAQVTMPPPASRPPPYPSPPYPSPPYPFQSRGWDRFGAPRTAPFYRYNPDLGAPRTAPFFNPYSPAVTGGGSLGYNQNLWNW